MVPTTVRLTDALSNASKPTLSFEFFPPKSDAATDQLWNSFEELQKAKPDFVSVTYGAMGSNQEKSLEIVTRMAPQVSTIAHLTCIGATEANINALLADYELAGVAGILALRGDVPQGGNLPTDSDYRVALDLVRHVARNSKFEVGVAAFPEKHPESASFDQDLEVLKLKQAAGAAFAMTQLFFDIDSYFQLVDRSSSAGVAFPIIPGVMPIANAKQVIRMAEMSGARIPPDLLSALSSAGSDQDAREIGMAFTADLAKQLLDRGVPGIHIFTLNQHEAALELATAIGLA